MSQKRGNAGSDLVEVATESGTHGDEEASEWKLRLYVELETPDGARSAAQVRQLLSNQLSGRFELEVVDPYADRERTRSDGVVATPTLVRTFPLPTRKVVGDLSDEEQVFRALGPH